MSAHEYRFDEVTSLPELDRQLERVGIIESDDGETYDAEEAERRVDRLQRYVEDHGGIDDRVHEMLDDITPAGGLRDTVKRILTETYD